MIIPSSTQKLIRNRIYIRLAYAHFDIGVSPAPGPCKNHRLLIPDYGKHEWKGRPDLVMATAHIMGDYRRVSKEVWEKFCEYYKGSGPEIKTTFSPDPELKFSGKFDTSSWIIDQTNYMAESGHIEGKVKKKKLKLFKKASANDEGKQKIYITKVSEFNICSLTR